MFLRLFFYHVRGRAVATDGCWIFQTALEEHRELAWDQRLSEKKITEKLPPTKDRPHLSLLRLNCFS